IISGGNGGFSHDAIGSSGGLAEALLPRPLPLSWQQFGEIVVSQMSPIGKESNVHGITRHGQRLEAEMRSLACNLPQPRFVPFQPQIRYFLKVQFVGIVPAISRPPDTALRGSCSRTMSSSTMKCGWP